MSGKCVTKKDNRKGRGGSPSASRSPVLSKCMGLQLSREKACQEKDAHPFQADTASSEGTQLSQWNPGSIQLPFASSVGTSVQCTTCAAAVATLMLCRHLGGEDPDFTIEMAQQTPGTLGEDSHVKAHIGKFHNLGNKGMMLERLGRSKAKVTFARSETRKASNTSRATLDVKRLWRHFHRSETESYHMPTQFHS